MTPDLLNDLICNRRAIFPSVFTDQPVDREIVHQLIVNACWAPSHRRTEPWRFQVFRGSALVRLADRMAEAYVNQVPKESFTEAKRKKIMTNVQRSDTVILIMLQRDKEERVPEWEEVAAVSMAVQNLWLSAAAYGLGGYWSTPSYIHDLNDWLDLPEGQKCLGLFYLGHYEMPFSPGQRDPIDEKVVWIEE